MGALRHIANTTSHRGWLYGPQDTLMRTTKRLGTIALLAASLAVTSTILTPATARAADVTAVSTTVTLADACAKLAELIAFLEARPAGPLRDFLLAQARRLELKYCL
jgi:hypothetical protein